MVVSAGERTRDYGHSVANLVNDPYYTHPPRADSDPLQSQAMGTPDGRLFPWHLHDCGFD